MYNGILGREMSPVRDWRRVGVSVGIRESKGFIAKSKNKFANTK